MRSNAENKKVLSGNEAIAHGAYAAGITVASAYPGTPSTEILENIAKFPEIYCEWAVNEKVGMEVVIGASFAGARSLTTMKHVGLNVALDPLMTFAYVGANGGMVIVSADDPGMHSSQNEQDNRILAKFAHIPMLEPADSQECYDMTRAAIEISEEFDIPVMLRTTTRISHSSGIVELGDIKSIRKLQDAREQRVYKKDIARTVPVPMFARRMRVTLENKVNRLAEYSNNSPFQKIEPGGPIGIITSGVSYQYAREAFPDASILKLGMTYPIPKDTIQRFAESVEKLYVIEEGEEYLEEQIRAMGIAVQSTKTNLRIGELSPDRIQRLAAELYDKAPLKPKEAIGDLPARPPVLCPGCSHRGVFYALNRLKAFVTGDIGCYSLGAFAPLSAMDTIVCMGASVGNAHGLEKAGQPGRVAAVIGDSTFFHSGMTGLLNIVYNRGNSTTIVLDNRTTAMTGHQDNPGTGKTLMGEQTTETLVEDVARGLGVKRVRVIDPNDLNTTIEVLKEELDSEEPSVVVSKRACVLGSKTKITGQFTIDQDTCTACGVCLRLGCPAIEVSDPDPSNPKKRKARINPVLCVGCGMCVQVCKFGAIREA
ncbi:MAG: indolepyruvate ferredoxin oxidoreductase subunit alpha [Armatimonadetes bacterium]|nr:indolepyruvate ferredoxin oxidoreductase subunit alpha [Armatimonadota bacterium]